MVLRPNKTLEEEASDRGVQTCRCDRGIVANHARIIGEKAPPACGVPNDRIGVNHVTDGRREIVTLVGDVIPAFCTTRQDVVD
jgi:hypothetical protein